MRIAIASGKGGTGKTSVATNLAIAASLSGRRVAYADCDVEEPNGHLFLRPKLSTCRAVCAPMPDVDREACTLCGQCASFCLFNALALVGGRVLVFPELCHGCGGCMRICPNMAICDVERPIGTVETGRAEGMGFVQGRLNVGEVMVPRLIRAVKGAASPAELVFLDAPPGTSCPVIETVRGCDYVVLVTEPTPFGLHDLKLAVEVLEVLELPYGIVINRADSPDNEAAAWCRQNGVRVLAELPEDRRVAEAYSRGDLAASAVPGYAARFEQVLAAIADETDKARRATSPRRLPSQELEARHGGRPDVAAAFCEPPDGPVGITEGGPSCLPEGALSSAAGAKVRR